MMDVAERLFSRHGFGGVSVEDVTTAVGVKKPDLYNHFRDKNELYIAVRLRRLRRLEDDLGRIANSGLSLSESLAAAAAVMMRQPHFLSALVQREAETFLPPASRDLLFARAYAAIYRPLWAILSAGAAELPEGLPASRYSLATEAFIGLSAHFAALHAAEGSGPDALLAAAEDVAALWRNGVSGLSRAAKGDRPSGMDPDSDAAARGFDA